MNTCTPQEIGLLFEASGTAFIEGITINQNLKDYIDKVFLKSHRYEIWSDEVLVGLLAFYRNDIVKQIYVTSISISEKFQGMGYGKYLFEKLLADNGHNRINSIRLEVRSDNQKALSFYNSLNFEIKSTQNQSHILERML